MGTISINPDADGDLHDASLHNDKFQTVVNEINGQIDENNLKYPNCIIPVQFGAAVSFGLLAGPVNHFQWASWGHPATASDKTSPLNVTGVATMVGQMLPQIGAGECNLYMNSMFRNTTGNAMTIPAGTTMWFQRSAVYNAANITVYLQKASGSTAAWSDMGSVVIDPRGAAAATTGVNSEATFALTDASLPDTYWFRVLVQNNAGTALSAQSVPPPISGGTVFFKALGLA